MSENDIATGPVATLVVSAATFDALCARDPGSTNC